MHSFYFHFILQYEDIKFAAKTHYFSSISYAFSLSSFPIGFMICLDLNHDYVIFCFCLNISTFMKWFYLVFDFVHFVVQFYYFTSSSGSFLKRGLPKRLKRSSMWSCNEHWNILALIETGFLISNYIDSGIHEITYLLSSTSECIVWIPARTVYERLCLWCLMHVIPGRSGQFPNMKIF